MSEPSRYHPSLDGVRFFCIIITVTNHVPDMPRYFNGRVGVDIFFALSGWLITWLLISERSKYGSISLGAFYVRRAFRIVPLYFATIALYVVAAFVSAHVTQDASHISNMRGALPYLVTFFSECRASDAGTFMGHAWTLGIEEKFYIAWPLVLVATGRLRVVLLCLCAVFVLGSWNLCGDALAVPRGYLGLGFGTVCALVAARNSAWRSFLMAKPVPYVTLAVIAACYGFGAYFPDDVLPYLGISATAALLIGSLWLNKDSPVSRILGWKPISALGRLTYGLYLIHVLVINVVTVAMMKLDLPMSWPVVFCISYAGAVAAAFALHIVLEQPLIAVGRKIAGRVAGRTSRMATAPAQP